MTFATRRSTLVKSSKLQIGAIGSLRRAGYARLVARRLSSAGWGLLFAGVDHGLNVTWVDARQQVSEGLDGAAVRGSAPRPSARERLQTAPRVCSASLGNTGLRVQHQLAVQIERHAAHVLQLARPLGCLASFHGCTRSTYSLARSASFITLRIARP
jgi:hypothetical protein